VTSSDLFTRGRIGGRTPPQWRCRIQVNLDPSFSRLIFVGALLKLQLRKRLPRLLLVRKFREVVK